MATKRQPARRRTPAKRRTTARKRPVRRVRAPKGGPFHTRLTRRLALFVATRFDDRGDAVRSRRDAAILRATHKGCATCGGNGQLFTKDKKTGAFSGSKPCPAKPTKERVSRWTVYRASRIGADRRTGLVGWSCPCGKRAKPRYRDAKEATKALRTHERDRHGGKSVGGAWYAQATEASVAPPSQQKPAVSKVVTSSGMTDEQWIKQNKKMHPAAAIKKGLCWKCAGNGKLHGAFGGEQIVIACTECSGTGKAPTAASARS